MPLLDAVLVLCDHPDCRSVCIAGKRSDRITGEVTLVGEQALRWKCVVALDASPLAYCPEHKDEHQ
jgi:hypothetical protein